MLYHLYLPKDIVKYKVNIFKCSTSIAGAFWPLLSPTSVRQKKKPVNHTANRENLFKYHCMSLPYCPPLPDNCHIQKGLYEGEVRFSTDKQEKDERQIAWQGAKPFGNKASWDAFHLPFSPSASFHPYKYSPDKPLPC